MVEKFESSLAVDEPTMALITEMAEREVVSKKEIGRRCISFYYQEWLK